MRNSDHLVHRAIAKAHRAGEQKALDRVFAALGRTLAARFLPELTSAAPVLKAHEPHTKPDLDADPHDALLLAQIDHLIRSHESGTDPDSGFRALHEFWHDPDALAAVLHPHMGDDKEFAKSVAYALYLKAVERSPKGGISMAGKFFPGGQWIPSSTVAAASQEEKTELAERKQGARPNPFNARDKAKAATAAKRGTRDELRKRVANIATDIMLHPDDRTPDKYRDLADALRGDHLSVADLRAMRLKLSASFGGGRRRDQMVAALLAHADSAANELDVDNIVGQLDAPDEKPTKSAKPSKKPSSKQVDTILQKVLDYGGIDPKSHEFLTSYENTNAAMQDKVPLFAFRENGRGLDQIARELEANGHIQVPGDKHAGEYVLDLLREKALNLHVDLTKEYDKAYDEYDTARAEAERLAGRDRAEAVSRSGAQAGLHQGAQDPLGEHGGAVVAPQAEPAAPDELTDEFLKWWGSDSNEPFQPAGGPVREESAPAAESAPTTGESSVPSTSSPNAPAPSVSELTSNPAALATAAASKKSAPAQPPVKSQPAAPISADEQRAWDKLAEAEVGTPAYDRAKADVVAAKQKANAAKSATSSPNVTPANPSVADLVNSPDIAARAPTASELLSDADRAELSRRRTKRTTPLDKSTLNDTIAPTFLTSTGSKAVGKPSEPTPTVSDETHELAVPGSKGYRSRALAQSSADDIGPNAVVAKRGDKWHVMVPKLGTSSVPTATTPPSASSIVALPDDEFVAKVQQVADAHPRGFGGNKTFISDVYYELKKEDPALTEDAFKARLVDAHRKDGLTLSRADLVQLMHPDDVSRSETKHPTGLGTYHFVLNKNPVPKTTRTQSPEEKLEAHNQFVRDYAAKEAARFGGSPELPSPNGVAPAANGAGTKSATTGVDKNTLNDTMDSDAGKLPAKSEGGKVQTGVVESEAAKSGHPHAALAAKHGRSIRGDGKSLSYRTHVGHGKRADIERRGVGREVGEVFHSKQTGGPMLITSVGKPQFVSDDHIEDNDAWHSFKEGAGWYADYTAVPVHETEDETFARSAKETAEKEKANAAAKAKAAADDAWSEVSGHPAHHELPAGVPKDLKWETVSDERTKQPMGYYGRTRHVATLPDGRKIGHQIDNNYDDYRDHYHVPKDLIESPEATSAAAVKKAEYTARGYGATPEDKAKAVAEFDRLASEHHRLYGTTPAGLSPAMQARERSAKQHIAHYPEAVRTIIERHPDAKATLAHYAASGEDASLAAFKDKATEVGDEAHGDRKTKFATAVEQWEPKIVAEFGQDTFDKIHDSVVDLVNSYSHIEHPADEFEGEYNDLVKEKAKREATSKKRAATVADKKVNPDHEVSGNTYPHKERIKALGGRWKDGRWVIPASAASKLPKGLSSRPIK